ncbi:MAG: hypothetical protein ACK5M3_05430 [Dysgonomonas sp.]
MKNKTKPISLEIGTRNLASITEEEVLQVAIIEGCHPHLEYWHKPEITDFNNTMFSDTVVIDYHSVRISDELESPTIVFFLNHKKLNYHYLEERNRNRCKSNRFSFETIRYLLKQGFYLPLID